MNGVLTPYPFAAIECRETVENATFQYAKELFAMPLSEMLGTKSDILLRGILKSTLDLFKISRLN